MTVRQWAICIHHFTNHACQPANKLPPPIPSVDGHAHPTRDCLALCSDRDARRKLFAPLCRHLPKYVLMTEIVRMVSETTRLTSDNSFCSLAICILKHIRGNLHHFVPRQSGPAPTRLT